jgi:hypothetical protein
MTAGKGVVHGEMFPLVNDKSPNTLRLFQIWLNLPQKSKMVSPAFAMVTLPFLLLPPHTHSIGLKTFQRSLQRMVAPRYYSLSSLSASISSPRIVDSLGGNFQWPNRTPSTTRLIWLQSQLRHCHLPYRNSSGWNHRSSSRSVPRHQSCGILCGRPCCLCEW